MAHYRSEFTEFLTKLRAERPHLDAEQRKGRDIWWDRGPIDMDRTRRNLQSKVAQKAYPYQAETEAELERQAAGQPTPRS